MGIKLDARTVANLKPAAKGATYTSDAIVAGLQLRIAEDGSKSGSLRYRIHGQQRRIGLGDYPRVTLAVARVDANKALRKVDGDVDPQAERQAAKRAVEQAKRDSIEKLCEDYIERHAKPRKRTWRDDQGKINCEILPRWKGRPVSAITRRDCRELLQAIADRPAPIYANRISALLSRLFRFAVDEEIIDTNPAAQLPKIGVEAQSRPDGERESKAYSADEVRAIWQVTETLDPAPRALYRLGLITGQRPGEISGLEWAEVEGAWWTIPGRRSKNGREHRVFLTQAALDLLKDVPRTEDEPRIFVGWRGKRQLAAVNTTVFAEVRRREKPRHAMRDTVATGLAQSGVAIEDIAKVLNHTYGPRVTAGYNAYAYDRERRLALLKWGRTLAAILESKNATNVVAFARS
jgi:integrase